MAVFCKYSICVSHEQTQPFPHLHFLHSIKEWAEVNHVIRSLNSNCPSLWPRARSPALGRVVFLWGMHKVEVTRVTSVPALWVHWKKRNHWLYFPKETLEERPDAGWPGGKPVFVLNSEPFSFSIHEAYLGICAQTLMIPPDPVRV